ncbi:MAG: beta-Ala-His dipeptidase, partial [Spirochaetota bacterium]
IDSVGNVIVYKAAQNTESERTIILQSHIDMVCESSPDFNINFETDPIVLEKDGNLMKAVGTTLGADNGIGAAVMLSILEDKEISHPKIEALFTVDEETGLTGALGLDRSLLSGEYLINLDTEEDDSVYRGCAGGQNIEAVYNLKKQDIPDSTSKFNISVSGLKGGHSGLEINDNLGNALKFIAFIVSYLINENIDFNIIHIEGGKAHNAIPRDAGISIAVNVSDKSKALDILDDRASMLIDAYKSGTEKGLEIKIDEIEPTYHKAIDKEQSKNIIMALNSIHSGVYRMSKTDTNLVETSTNLSIVEWKDDSIVITASSRSSDKFQIEYVIQGLSTLFKSAKADNINLSSRYPGWNPLPVDKNPLLKKYIEVHKKIKGEEPKVCAVHAGLECGVFTEKLPGIKMISIGPDIKYPHSPSEQVSIKSVDNFWKIVLELLKTL